jgi:glycosyltransferase involved in cell wall biosynthesis
MKILVVSFYYEPEIGAAPSRITNLVRGLKERGAQVDVLTCLPNYPKGRIFDGYRGRFSMKENLDGVNVYRYWTYATVSKGIVRRALAMTSFAVTMWAFGLKRKLIHSYDKVIIQSPPIMVSASAMSLFKCCFGKKVVLNVSDLWPGSAVELGFMKENSLSYKFTSRQERKIYRRADAVMGQSNGILDRVRSLEPDKRLFLYRNLSRIPSGQQAAQEKTARTGSLKIAYAGLLGVPQDVLSIVRNVDFESVGAEFHIYGGGNQAEDIKNEIAAGKKNVFYHGVLAKEQMNKVMGSEYDVSLIALAKSITGAVPSKIFDTLPLGIPLLFCGTGEGAEIVRENGFGLVSAPSDFRMIEDKIREFAIMDADEFHAYSQRCRDAAAGSFNFDSQFDTFMDFLGMV